MAGAKTGAALPLETADASGVTVEDQVAVLAAHTVAKETAALTEQLTELREQNATLTTENASLKDQLTVAQAATETAKQEFADFKAAEAAKVEQAKLADARKAEVAKVAPALLEGDEDKVAERLTRWTQMDEAAFTAYVAELASVAGTTEKKSGEPFTGESAMERKPKPTFTGTSLGRVVLDLPSKS